MAKKSEISKKGRFQKALELKLRGLNDVEISKRLGEEGIHQCSPRTISRILHEAQPEEVTEELKRQQLRDITTSDVDLRLKYRDKLLDRQTPRTVEQKVSGQLNHKIEVEKHFTGVGELVEKYGDAILDEAMRRRLQRDRGDAEKDTGKPLDPKPADG